MGESCTLSCGVCVEERPIYTLAEAPWRLVGELDEQREGAEREAARGGGGVERSLPLQLVLLGEGAGAAGDAEAGEDGDVSGGGATSRPLGPPNDDPLVELSAGEVHLLGRTASGALYTWGDNSLGQLGRSFAAAREPYTAWRAHRMRWPAPLPATAPAVSVSAGRMHSAAVLATGEVFAWGDNSHGQCGVPLEMTPLSAAPPELEMLDAPIATPVRVPLPEAARAVACGELHCLTLGTSGAVYGWGDNVYGQLGAVTEHASEGPLRLKLPTRPGETVIALAAASFHSLALTDAGRVLGWGDNTHGQLGRNRRGFVAALLPGGVGGESGAPTEEEFEAEFTAAAAPAFLPLELHAGEAVVAVSVGAYHSGAVTSSGRLLLWGDNTYGQLGAEASNSSEVGESLAATPLGGVYAHALALGEYHTLVLTNGSRLLSFGLNGRQQLGRMRGVGWDAMPAAAELPIPHPRGAPTDALAIIAAGPFYSAAATADGHLYVWGEHPSALTRAGGARAGAERSVQELLNRAPGGAPAAGGVPAFADGAPTGASLASDGAELPDGGEEVQVGPAGARVLAAAVCGFHVLAATAPAAHDDGDGPAIWSWGEDAARQLCRTLPAGIDLDEVPRRVSPLLSRGELALFGCGGFHTLLASAAGAGTVFRCGESSESLEEAAAAHGAAEVAEWAEGAPSADEYDRGWSASAAQGGGEAADNGAPPRITAEQLPGFDPTVDSLVQLVGGHVHSLALSASGRVWSWGSNSHGQLGRLAAAPPGTAAAMRTHPPAPVVIGGAAVEGGGARVVHVAAGAYHSLAVTADGEVYSWGTNSHAQLARPSAALSDARPTRVPLPAVVEGDRGGCDAGASYDVRTQTCAAGNARPIEVSAGVHHTLVLLSDGRVCAFGDNMYGQQGRPVAARAGAMGACEVASAVPGGVVQLAAGELHAVALSARGEVYTWGGNSNGQLGRSVALLSPVPARVPLRLRRGEVVVSVSAGGYRTGIVTNQGRLLMLGRAATVADEESGDEIWREDAPGVDDAAESDEDAASGLRVELQMRQWEGGDLDSLLDVDEIDW